MTKSFILYEKNQHQITIFSKGEWTLHTIHDIRIELSAISYEKDIVWDVSGVSEFDSAGVLLFIEYLKKFKEKINVNVVGYSNNQHEMYVLLNRDSKPIDETPQKGFLEKLGRDTIKMFMEIQAFIAFLGQLYYVFFLTLIKPKNIRFKEMVYHIHQSGFNALMIIGLTSFLVGMVIAYQGSVQLAKFGADIFIVDTVAISITRELGPMITAIVIAGRSGSAYTAEIGAMKITEETAAMRTMGFDPFTFLVLPRVIALMISLPLLIFFADIMGILGGMMASSMQLGLSVGQFIDRLYEVLEVKHYILGMVKGPVFAFLIATIGCFQGFQVSNNTESIGHHTTKSVVHAIFMVIAFDALFSVIYTELNL
ncbi:MAG: ABC transporter permease [Campylobacterota bacterium]|nr:ABC transporter permease [Campylobacterota bacterium]